MCPQSQFIAYASGHFDSACCNSPLTEYIQLHRDTTVHSLTLAPSLESGVIVFKGRESETVRVEPDQDEEAHQRHAERGQEDEERVPLPPLDGCSFPLGGS
mgnify:CR=1 FL=1